MAWQQVETSLNLLFNGCRLDVIMWNFSVKHRLYVLLPFGYGLTRLIISHDNIGVMLFSFRLQMCIEYIYVYMYIYICIYI